VNALLSPPTHPPDPHDTTEVAYVGERRRVVRWRVVHRRVELVPGGRRSGRGRPELRLGELIGVGGMGSVHRARQTSLDRDIAVKRLSPDSTIPSAARYFESEACIAALLHHPNIAPVHDLGIDQNGLLFYTMKLIDGASWEELLERRTAPSAGETSCNLAVLDEVANAVAFAHSRGFIHRDIKPANVLVGDFGEVTLVDWGLSVAVAPLKRDARILHLDEVTITCGTPAYMPPEVATGQRAVVGTWSDTYMLGATLFEILYFRAPHEAPTHRERLTSAMRNAWTFPSVIPPAIAPYHTVLAPVLRRALATEPAERYRDASELRDAMRAALSRLEAAEMATRAIAGFQAFQQRVMESGPMRKRAVDLAARLRDDLELARIEAVLGLALESWPDYREAHWYLVEAHLLRARLALRVRELELAGSRLESIENLSIAMPLHASQQQRMDRLRHGIERCRRARAYRRSTLHALAVTGLLLVLALGSAIAWSLVRA
jgi:hypothetical protein